MKEHFNKELVKTKIVDKEIDNSTKSWVCDNGYADGEVKVRDHCQITGKHKGSAQRDCNIKVGSYHKFLLYSAT